MSDTGLVVTGGVIVALIGIVPATYQAFSANRKLRSVKDTLGEKNGNGDINQMVSRVLAWQAEQSKAQEEALTAMRNKETEFSAYSHDRFHHLINMLTIIKGKQDLMWPWVVEQMGLDIDLEVPVPYPEADPLMPWEDRRKNKD